MLFYDQSAAGDYEKIISKYFDFNIRHSLVFRISLRILTRLLFDAACRPITETSFFVPARRLDYVL